MSFQALTKTIESHDFSALMGLANNAKMFRELARRDRSVQELADYAHTPTTQRDVLNHLVHLIREQDDVRYRNTRDAAIAVYVWCLAETNPSLARIAASHVLAAPRLWWARKVALHVVTGASFDVAPGLDTYATTVTVAPIPTPTTNVTAGVAENLIVPLPSDQTVLLEPVEVKSAEGGTHSVTPSPPEFVTTNLEVRKQE